VIFNPFGPFGYSFGFGIAAHEGDAGDHGAVAVEESGEKFFGQWFADVFRQMRAVATRTVAWTIREIQSECYLARNLLKNDVK